MKQLLAASLFLGALAVSAGCSQTRNLPTINASWADDATDHRGNTGERYRYVCPPHSIGSGMGTVWGTEVYSDDSAVCVAAVHAGAISLSGGTVTIEMRDGLSSYQGSTQNGITTQNWGEWHSSFVVL